MKNYPKSFRAKWSFVKLVPGGSAAGQKGLEPGALVQHGEEALLEVDDDELEEEGHVVAAMVAVPD
jgi:hypothetical protein